MDTGSNEVSKRADVADLEALEMAEDVADYREAKRADDGARVTLDELRDEFAT